MTPEEVRGLLERILHEVDEFCRENAIPYYLYAGTLLGAVRHGGFIPWDDDLDIMMARPDFERFCAQFPSRPDLELVTRHTHRSYPYASAKVASTDTEVVEEVDLAARDRFGVAVDVLPFDRVPDHAGLSRVQVWLAWAVRAALLLKVVQPTANRSVAERALLRVTRLVLRPLPVPLLVAARERIATLWRSRRSDHVSMLIASVPWRVPTSMIEPPSQIEFEGRPFPAPHDSHGLLTAVYGADYMQPPQDAAGRAPHLATAYRKR
jgi:lipopolysaccharide cholinephosphotransferase